MTTEQTPATGQPGEVRSSEGLGDSVRRRRLGELVKAETRCNPDGCEVELSTLSEIGLDLNSQLYADWLTEYGLRMCRPTRKAVCFVEAPELPPYLRDAAERWRDGQQGA